MNAGEVLVRMRPLPSSPAGVGGESVQCGFGFGCLSAH